MRRRWSMVLALVALAATACPSGDPGSLGEGEPVADATQAPASAVPSASSTDEPSDEPTDVPTDGGSDLPPHDVVEASGRLRVASCEPGSLRPADAAGCAAPIARLLHAPLTVWADDGTAEWGEDAPDALLADVASDDARTWTLTLRDDRTHHDGTPVLAEDVARGWRDAAFGPNARAYAHLLRDVVGFDDLRCGPATDCATAEVPPDLAGVEVVDETTLRVTLVAPDRQFPVRLGHPAFSPLPAAVETDPDGWDEQPIGSGPMRMEGPWRHDERIVLTRATTATTTPDDAPDPVLAAQVEFVLLDDPAAGMAGLRDAELDVVAGARPFDPVLGGGSEVTGPANRTTFVLWPGGPPDPRLAQALSLALDTTPVVEHELGGLGQPVPTSVPAHLADVDAAACEPACGHDPARAAVLADRAGGFPGDHLSLLVPAGLGDPELAAVRAVVAQWEGALPPLTVDVEEVPVADLPDRLADPAPDEVARLSWAGDLPTVMAHLRPLHTPDGAFALDGFDHPAVTAAIDAVAEAPTDAAATAALDDAQRAVAASGHHVPLWADTVRVLLGPRVASLPLDPLGVPRYASATLTP